MIVANRPIKLLEENYPQNIHPNDSCIHQHACEWVNTHLLWFLIHFGLSFSFSLSQLLVWHKMKKTFAPIFIWCLASCLQSVLLVTAYINMHFAQRSVLVVTTLCFTHASSFAKKMKKKEKECTLASNCSIVW